MAENQGQAYRKPAARVPWVQGTQDAIPEICWSPCCSNQRVKLDKLDKSLAHICELMLQAPDCDKRVYFYQEWVDLPVEMKEPAALLLIHHHFSLTLRVPTPDVCLAHGILQLTIWESPKSRKWILLAQSVPGYYDYCRSCVICQWSWGD